jgi:tRNA-dihydrouridine synthase A
MMERTDRFYRYFLRLITRHTLLYTEMITSAAVLNGDRDQLLAFDAAEHPVALQLGGSEPGEMAACARIAEEHGFDEVNMNVGCPSKRVRAGRFGACLMAEPQRVADCVAAMASTVGITGLSPKQNRDVPPLRYDIVHQLKQDFPSLTIILNGGVTTLDQTRQHLSRLDGVMIGRAAYRDPYMLAQADRQIFDTKSAAPSRREIIEAYLPYAARELQRGARLAHLTRHLTGLYLGQPGARAWRRAVSALASIDGATEQDLLGAIPQCSTQAAALANDAAA